MTDLWGRFFAWMYDRSFRGAEAAGLREMRRDLLRTASGRTLEIGAGTGLNWEHYPKGAVSQLVLCEPSAPMAERLRRKIADRGIDTRIIETGGEKLPFEEGSFDTVVSTLVLCTTPEPAAVLREIARVLAPGGRLLFMEHVRSSDPRLARWQDRLAVLWRRLANGCLCNRDTLAVIARSPLVVESVRHAELLKMTPLVRPLIVGAARREPGRNRSAVE